MGCSLRSEEFKIHFRTRKISLNQSEDDLKCPDKSFRNAVSYTKYLKEVQIIINREHSSE